MRTLCLLALALLAACRDHRPPPAASAAPQVDAMGPAADVTVTAGGVVDLRYVDGSTGGFTDVVAVLEPGGTEIVVDPGRPHVDGTEQTVPWDTTGVPPGTYRIEFRSHLDGEETTTTAAGRVTVEAADPEPEPGPGGGAGDESGEAAAAFPDGSYAVGGHFEPPMPFPGGVVLEGGDAGVEGFVARYANDGALAWARGSHVERHALVTDVAALADGSLACCGQVSMPPTGGPFTLSYGEADAQTWNFPATPGANASHSFVALYAPDGSLLWLEGIEAGWNVTVEGVTAAHDPLGGPDGVLVVGTFENLAFGEIRGTVRFGAGTPSETTLELTGSQSMWFVARYENDGTFSWVKHGVHPSGFGYTDGYDIDAFPDGSFVICGSRGSNLVFGPGEAGETLLSSGAIPFVARFHADGTFDWVRTGTATGDAASADFGRAVAAADDGTAYFTGLYGGGTLTWHGDPDQIVTLPDSLNVSVLVRLDADGDALWAKIVGGSTYTHNCLAASETAVFMSGSVNHDTVFGEGEPNETLLVVSSGNTAFAARYESDGMLAWARQGMGTSHSNAEAIAADPFGGPVVAGYFYAMFQLDVGGPAPAVFESAGGSDFFVAPLHDND